jgi:AcrR family transcriptional regulator
MPRIVPTYREEAKKRILEVAEKVFKEKGYFKSSMNDIAKELGISKGSIYQYFDSKAQLLGALYSGGPDNLRSVFRTSSKESVKDTAKEVFAKMQTNTNARFFIDFLAAASRNPNLQKVLRENINRFNAILEDLLKERNPHMNSQEVKQAQTTSVMLGLIFNGLACWLAMGVSVKEVKEVWADSVDTLLGEFEGEKLST